jgi:hypothetical protein
MQSTVPVANDLSMPRSRGGAPRPETPHQIMEGAAMGAAAELVYYRDIDQPERLRGDAGCDDAVRRMERAFETGDRAAFHAAADDYWTADAEEDGAASRGDGRVLVAHRHIKRVPAMVETIEQAGRQLSEVTP